MESMLVRLAYAILLLTLPCYAAAESNFLSEAFKAPRFSRVTVSLGKDFYNHNDSGERYNTATLSFGRFPVESGFGYQFFGQAVDYLDKKYATDTNFYTLGADWIYAYKLPNIPLHLYGGVGLAWSDQTTSVSGTRWNFSLPIGLTYKREQSRWFLDLSLRHMSHGSKIGIESDKVNQGINVVSLGFGLSF